MRRALALALVIAGCSGGGDGSCDLDKVLDEDLTGVPAVDCGYILLGDDPGLMTARTCVQTALGESRTFRVMFDVQGTDSKVVRGYAADMTMLYAYAYDGDPSGGSHSGAVVDRSRCASIVDRTLCDGMELASSLCFMCTAPTADDHCEE